MNVFGRTIMAAAALAFGLVGRAYATPITYTFSGSAGGYTCTVCDGSDNTSFSGNFSLAISADTSAVDTSGPPYSRLNGVSGAFADGSVNVTLTGVTIVVNGDPAFENVNFFSSDFADGLGLQNQAALNGYQLLTSVGPITATGGDLSPTFGGGYFTTSGAERVYLTNNDSLTFAADLVQSVPEPASLSLFAASLAFIGILGLRRRRTAI
jgi:PEP-CTERM motif